MLLLDEYTFYGALVKHILSMLKERDNLLKDREWVLNEALSGKKLQSSGTFQNVLSRRLDEVVLPLFSSVLSFIDHYSNLDLIAQRLVKVKEARIYIYYFYNYSGKHSDNTPLQNLWLHIFSNEALCRFSYEAMTTGKSAGELHTAILGSAEFPCMFPFFWIIKDEIDSKWETAKAIGMQAHAIAYLYCNMLVGVDKQDVYMQLYSLLSETDISKILHTAVATEDWDKLYNLYLMDFLKSVHRVMHHRATDEYEV